MTIPMPGSPECECATCEGCAEERHEGLMREGEPCPACHVHADPSYRETKRLTDVECAAERGEARADWMYTKFLIASRQVVSMRARPNAPMPEPSPPLERKLNEARDTHYTWARFAAHPHALEEA